jgi:hypothetical protein
MGNQSQPSFKQSSSILQENFTINYFLVSSKAFPRTSSLQYISVHFRVNPHKSQLDRKYGVGSYKSQFSIIGEK